MPSYEMSPKIAIAVIRFATRYKPAPCQAYETGVPINDSGNDLSSHRDPRHAGGLSLLLRSEKNMARLPASLTPRPIRLADHRQHFRHTKVT